MPTTPRVSEEGMKSMASSREPLGKICIGDEHKEISLFVEGLKILDVLQLGLVI